MWNYRGTNFKTFLYIQRTEVLVVAFPNILAAGAESITNLLPPHTKRCETNGLHKFNLFIKL